ncbi:hypothetical protein TELCIR_10680 [Teladorsagia circumcincta]|uniref:Uncharacterized protein n=1 Tax=Teladorsagia circumcincta TaxID=45464 RepID=A0A2G9UCU9_TELCI|nr:hypothetical protein TELCIR_10680 [Teladorsagia circumcincta]
MQEFMSKRSVSCCLVPLCPVIIVEGPRVRGCFSKNNPFEQFWHVTRAFCSAMGEYVDDSSEGSSGEVSDMHYAKGVMTIVYIAVFIIGTPGNLWIIFKLIQARSVVPVFLLILVHH